jgi:hypothetical protein
LQRLALAETIKPTVLKKAVKELGLDPNKPDPTTV